MIITIKPDDILKRGLWSEYRKFVLREKSEDEVIEIVEKNEPTTISEEDAFVVGLLKIIETDNLVHRFNLHIQDILQIKSNIFDDGLYINKNIITKEVVSFKSRFPEYYKPSISFEKSINELFNYIDDIKGKLENLEIYEYTSNDKPYEFYNSHHVRKILVL